jgi:4-hydroxy-4-methyl-2-oxoglutarate aldolase
MIKELEFVKLEEILYTAVIADILDELGRRTCASSQGLHPIDPDMKVFGKVFTILATDVYEIPAEPYKLEIEAVDSVSKGEVVVATTNGSVSNGFWGELLSTAVKSRGGRGAVIDGLIRDQKQIIEMCFPTFARGNSPYDSKGRAEVIAYQVPIAVGGVKVFPGDLVFADIDGVVFISRDVQDEVIKRALEKVTGENKVREEILNGMSMKEAFSKYGIL